MEVTTDMSGPTPGSNQAQSLDPGTWRCMVCTKPSNEMRVLPCQHKFCENCLKLWALIYIDMYNGRDDEFPCQICWKRYAVPPQGLEAYEQDYQVKVLQETMKLMSMGQGQPGGQGQGQGHDPTQSGPFSFTPQLPPNVNTNNIINTNSNSGARIPEDFADYMQQPYGSNEAPMGRNTAGMDSVTEPTPQRQPEILPSMVTHMVPQPYTATQECLQENGRAGGPGYCLRSCHMYMHMV